MLALPGWQRLAVAAALGAVAAFGQAPYDQPIVLVIAFIACVFLYRSVQSQRQAALLGWALRIRRFRAPNHGQFRNFCFSQVF